MATTRTLTKRFTIWGPMGLEGVRLSPFEAAIAIRRLDPSLDPAQTLLRAQKGAAIKAGRLNIVAITR